MESIAKVGLTCSDSLGRHNWTIVCRLRHVTVRGRPSAQGAGAGLSLQLGQSAAKYIARTVTSNNSEAIAAHPLRWLHDMDLVLV